MVLKIYLKILLIILFYAGEFDNFILADEVFGKASQTYENCALVNKNLCGKLFPSLEWPTIFDECFKVTSVPFFIPDFNLLSCKLDNFTFNLLYWRLFIWHCHLIFFFHPSKFTEHVTSWVSGCEFEINQKKPNPNLNPNLDLLLPSIVCQNKVCVFIMIFTALSFLWLIHCIFVIWGGNVS